MEVLLVIDMQKISFTQETPRYDTVGVVQRINMLSSHFRKNGLPVIIVQQDGSHQGFCKKGTEEWEILDEIKLYDDDIILPKTANDAFYRTELKTMLQKLGADTIVVTGCATDFCVDSTVKGALVNDFNVKVIGDAHTTADKPQIPAKDAIAYFNWLWSESIPTKGKILVQSALNYIG